MLGVIVSVCRFVSDSFPGFVECRLMDARGRQWSFIEKVPIVSLAKLDANSAYPQPGVIACRVVEKWQDSEGRELVSIDTELPWHIESTGGETRFEVLSDQLNICESQVIEAIGYRSLERKLWAR